MYSPLKTGRSELPDNAVTLPDGCQNQEHHQSTITMPPSPAVVCCFYKFMVHPIYQSRTMSCLESVRPVSHLNYNWSKSQHKPSIKATANYIQVPIHNISWFVLLGPVESSLPSAQSIQNNLKTSSNTHFIVLLFDPLVACWEISKWSW